jgi:uncharacterized protein YjiS (DUF1127 family)
VRGSPDVRSSSLETECCLAPSCSGWRDRVNLVSTVRRWATRYGQRAAYGQLDEHLLDDIGVDEKEALSRSRQRRDVFRRMWIAGCGG